MPWTIRVAARLGIVRRWETGCLWGWHCATERAWHDDHGSAVDACLVHGDQHVLMRLERHGLYVLDRLSATIYRLVPDSTEPWHRRRCHHVRSEYCVPPPPPPCRVCGSPTGTPCDAGLHS